MRNYKFRLYPTAEQEERLVETLDGCRWVYNYFYKNNMSIYDMQFALTEMKEQHPWLYTYHSKMLQMVVHKIDAARKALHALRRNGYKIGRLHYLSHEECNSFTYNQSGFKIEGNQLWLSKIGSIEIRLHRQPVNIKQVTVVRQASGMQLWPAKLRGPFSGSSTLADPSELMLASQNLPTTLTTAQ